jgi:hypothetical protein
VPSLRSFIAFLTFVDAFLPYLAMIHPLVFRRWTRRSTLQRCIKNSRPPAVRATPACAVGIRETGTPREVRICSCLPCVNLVPFLSKVPSQTPHPVACRGRRWP